MISIKLQSNFIEITLWNHPFTRKIESCRHTTSFQRQYHVARRSDVVYLRGSRIISFLFYTCLLIWYHDEHWNDHCTKNEVSCGFGHIYWRNPWWKTSFFVQWIMEILKIRKIRKITKNKKNHKKWEKVKSNVSLKFGWKLRITQL